MPILSRRRETDYRAPRLESEIREPEKDRLKGVREIPQCGKCKRMFEEKSRVCPRCDTKTMGLIKQVPEQHLEQYQRNAMRRLGR